MPPRPSPQNGVEGGGGGSGGGRVALLWPAAMATAIVAVLLGMQLQKHIAEAPSTPSPSPSPPASDAIVSDSEPPPWNGSTFPELPAVAQPIHLARDLGYMDAAEVAEMEARVDVRKELVCSIISFFS